MGYNGGQYDSSAIHGTPSPSSFSKTYPTTSYFPLEQQDDHIYRKDSTLKRKIRLFRLVSRIATLILSAYTTYTQALSLHRFLSTRDIVISGRNAWAKQTTIWPTCVLLVTSALTCIVALITIGTYFRSIKTANRTSATLGTATTIAEMAAHLAVWIGATAAYRIGKTEKDLWGWTCSDKADAIQEQFQDVLNFGKLCDTQTNAWYTSIAQAALAMITLVIWGLAWRRMKHKERMEKHVSLLTSMEH